MSAKRTYAKVVSGDENTPDDGYSWMQAYQQESEEDALKKAIKLSKVKSWLFNFTVKSPVHPRSTTR